MVVIIPTTRIERISIPSTLALQPSSTSRAHRPYAFAFFASTTLPHPTLVATHYPLSALVTVPCSHTRIDGHLAPPQPRYSTSNQACLNLTDCSPASACPKTREPTCKRFESDVAETLGNMYMVLHVPALEICF